MANKYWLGGERIGCRLYEIGTLEYVAKECEGMWRWGGGDIAELLEEKWIEKRNEAENDK